MASLFGHDRGLFEEKGKNIVLLPLHMAHGVKLDKTIASNVSSDLAHNSRFFSSATRRQIQRKASINDIMKIRATSIEVDPLQLS